MVQHLKQQLEKCEQHLQGAEKEIVTRTEAFQRDAAFFTSDIEGLKGQL
jgi:hypothetical protein